MKLMEKTKNKDEFIKKLASMTPEDINTLIRDKGKKPKLVKPLIRVYSGMEEDLYDRE